MLTLVPSNAPILRQPCRLVLPEELPELCDPKFLYRVDKFRRQQGGIGLAAPQVGDDRAWFCWNESFYDPKGGGVLVINPAVLFRSDALEYRLESCLSFPGKTETVGRPVEIEVEYWDERGNYNRKRLHHHRARVFLHEFDHLQGVCIVP